MNGRRGRGWRPREFNGSYVGIPTDNLSLQCAELGYLGVAGEPSSSRRELSPAAGGPVGGAFLHWINRGRDGFRGVLAPCRAPPWERASDARRQGMPRSSPVSGRVREDHVIDVALATRNIAHMRSIREHQLQPAVQDVPDRLPVDARGLHRYVRDPLRRQPIPQLQQIPGCR
jgi:hypothetical protein